MDGTVFASWFLSITGRGLRRKLTVAIETAGEWSTEVSGASVALGLPLAAELFAERLVIEPVTQSNVLLTVGTFRDEQLLLIVDRGRVRGRWMGFTSIITWLTWTMSTNSFVLHTILDRR